MSADLNQPAAPVQQPIQQPVQPAAAQPVAQPQPIPVTTPEQIHTETAQAVASNIGQILGSEHPEDLVMPVTEDTKPISPEREQLVDLSRRVFLDKPGFEPSKSFLKKMWERMKKKNPDAVITLKDE